MVYVSSDSHFYHSNIHIYEPSRPYNDEEVIVQRHNELVKKDDIWIFLGDLTCGLASSGKSKKDVQDLVQSMNGHKVFIKGNHDNFDKSFYEGCGFKKFYTYITLNKYFLCHYPLVHNDLTTSDELKLIKTFNENNNLILVHGHTHSKNMVTRGVERINVSLDYTNFYPTLLEL